MSVADVFNTNDHAEGIPTFTGGLYIPKSDQGASPQVQQDAASPLPQAGDAGKSVVKQADSSPRPESVGGDFNENDWSPV